MIHKRHPKEGCLAPNIFFLPFYHPTHFKISLFLLLLSYNTTPNCQLLYALIKEYAIKTFSLKLIMNAPINSTGITIYLTNES